MAVARLIALVVVGLAARSVDGAKTGATQDQDGYGQDGYGEPTPAPTPTCESTLVTRRNLTHFVADESSPWNYLAQECNRPDNNFTAGGCKTPNITYANAIISPDLPGFTTESAEICISSFEQNTNNHNDFLEECMQTSSCVAMFNISKNNVGECVCPPGRTLTCKAMTDYRCEPSNRNSRPFVYGCISNLSTTECICISDSEIQHALTIVDLDDVMQKVENKSIKCTETRASYSPSGSLLLKSQGGLVGGTGTNAGVRYFSGNQTLEVTCSKNGTTKWTNLTMGQMAGLSDTITHYHQEISCDLRKELKCQASVPASKQGAYVEYLKGGFAPMTCHRQSKVTPRWRSRYTSEEYEEGGNGRFVQGKMVVYNPNMSDFAWSDMASRGRDHCAVPGAQW